MQPAARRPEELPKAQTSKGFSGNKLALARPLCPKKLNTITCEQGMSKDIDTDPLSPMTIKHLKIDQSQKPGASDTNAFSKGPTRIGGKFFNRRKSSNMSTSFGNYTVITSKRNYEVLNPDLFSPSNTNAMNKKNLAQMLKQKYPPPVTMMLQPPPVDPTGELRRGYHARKDSQLIEEALSEDSAKASPGAGKPRMLSSEMLPEPGFDDPQAT
jgi:hypothetical protein